MTITTTQQPAASTDLQDRQALSKLPSSLGISVDLINQSDQRTVQTFYESLPNATDREELSSALRYLDGNGFRTGSRTYLYEDGAQTYVCMCSDWTQFIAIKTWGLSDGQWTALCSKFDTYLQGTPGRYDPRTPDAVAFDFDVRELHQLYVDILPSRVVTIVMRDG
jgi:hypothetical protein